MRGILKNISSYIKNNWGFLLVMIAGSAALLLQMSQVVLYADDYSLGIYSPEGIGGAFQYFINHYLNWGGGYTALIVIIFLMLSSFWWKLFLALLLILFVSLTIKMVCYNHQKSKWTAALILWCCVFALSIWISRETIYWLDGGVAYLFSAFQAFLFFYYMYTRLMQNVHKKSDVVLIPIFGFFAGWSSAQSGVVAIVAGIILLLWQWLVKKEKIKKLYLFSTILCVIGFLIFYFAPGNSARMSTFSAFVSYNIFEKIGYRVDSVFGLILSNTSVEFSAAPLFVYIVIGLTAVIDLHYTKNEKNKRLKVLRFCCSIYELLFMAGFLVSVMNIPILSTLAKWAFTYSSLLNMSEYGIIGYLKILPYIAAILALLSHLTSCFFICLQRSNPLLIAIVCMAYAAEFCMIAAPYSPLRTTFYTAAYMWVAICYLMILAKHERIEIAPIFILIFTIWNFYLGITALIIYLIIAKESRNYKNLIPNIEIYFSIVVFGLMSATNYIQILANYYSNKIINEENIARILEYKADYESGETTELILYLVQPKSETYGFTGLCGVDWVEDAVIDYFDLPENLDLIYEGETK